MNTDIIQQVEEASHLNKKSQVELGEIFIPLLEQAKEWKQKAGEIVVTNADQTDKMEEARVARKALSRIRINANEKRVLLKEESLMKGRAIDGMYNIIKYLVKPVEDHLKLQEDFIKIQEKNRLDDLEKERSTVLLEYMDDVSFYNLRNMDEQAYQTIVSNQKIIREKKDKEIADIEKKRLEDEAKEKERVADMEKENARLKKQSEKDAKILADKEKKDKIEKDKRDAIEKKRLSDELAVQKKKDAIEKARREKEQIRLDSERKKREQLEKKIADDKKKANDARLLKLENEKQARLAPDKEKLKRLAEELLAIDYPRMSNDESQQVVVGVQKLMEKVHVYIIGNVNNI